MGYESIGDPCPQLRLGSRQPPGYPSQYWPTHCLMFHWSRPLHHYKFETGRIYGKHSMIKRKTWRNLLFCQLSPLFQPRGAKRNGAALQRGKVGPPKWCVHIRASIRPATPSVWLIQQTLMGYLTHASYHFKILGIEQWIITKFLLCGTLSINRY